MTTFDPMAGRTASQKICWLASYPKSGNTWTRILLANLLGDEQDESDELTIDLAGSIASNRVQFDNLTGLSSSDMTDDEIDLLRPDANRAIAATAKKMIYTKVHDAYHDSGNGEAIFPEDCSFGVIYLVRNPLDVAVSYAYHQGHEGFAKVVEQMNNPTHVMAGGPKSQLRQKTLGWSGHYRSWHDQTKIPVLTIRYEDMIDDTAASVARMAGFIGLNKPDLSEKIGRAVEQSRFDTLREKEEISGFGERPEKSARFFRSGRVGEGRERLSADLQSKMIEANHPLMQELGYI
jgi:aryl sulfotransferase